MENRFHDNLKQKIDDYVHLVYKITRFFPKEELYGVTSQLRRSAISVMLNYIEGYARRRDKVYKNFLEISYGSLKESEYLLGFSFKESLISKSDYEKAGSIANDIGGMLWGVLRKI